MISIVFGIFGDKIMKKIINTKKFDVEDPAYISFYIKHGWVILRSLLSEHRQKAIILQLENIKIDYAKEMNIPKSEYEKEINQWRDLWLKGGACKELIYNENILQSIVKQGMKSDGIQLLHDHIISKPFNNNDKIPWHQDSMFWPVDLVGCSTWTPLEDVPINNGCLEVIDASHLKGCDTPTDFMSAEKTSFSENAKHVQLPCNAGDTILLSSLTWHRSAPNTGNTNRPAHIALWIHPDSKWRPDLVKWHPVNEFIETRPKEHIRGDRFPIFGKKFSTSGSVKNIHTGTDEKASAITMFNSSAKISEQFSRILLKEGSISTLLEEAENKKCIVEETINNGFCSEKDEITKVLHRLWISDKSYKTNQSRNIFNSAYLDWWQLAGEKWDKKLNLPHVKNTKNLTA